jgi:hypothetical protein
MSNFSAKSSWEYVTFCWDDNDVRFVLDQHPSIGLFLVLAGRHGTPLGHSD